MYQNFMNQYPQQTTRENINWITVNGIQGARDVQVMRGQTAWLMDMNEPIFYVKEADNMGICTIKAYRFEEIDLTEQKTQEGTYVTKEEFEQLRQEILRLGGAGNESVTTEK